MDLSTIKRTPLAWLVGILAMGMFVWQCSMALSCSAIVMMIAAIVTDSYAPWAPVIDDMAMVYVPAGEFRMGSDPGKDFRAYDDEFPQHRVTLAAFWIDKTEVTNGQYALCVKERRCRAPSVRQSTTDLKYYGNALYVDYPVINVDWNQARRYCEWKGKRLPTEAEWEKAARGTDERIFPWGNAIDKAYANYNFYVGAPRKVGSYPDGESPYGALDLAGNVWEWVNSQYRPYPYREMDGREDGNAPGDRVLRGGGWYVDARNVRSAHRVSIDPATTHYYVDAIGFRCASRVSKPGILSQKGSN